MKIRWILPILITLVLVPAARAEEGLSRIHLIFTSDIHGYVDPRDATFINPNFPPPIGGGASAARYVERLRDAIAGDPTQDVLLVDSGDVWQGSPVGTLTDGRVMEAYFNQLDYDAVVCGNHEFDKGRWLPERMAEQMQHPWVACNVIDTSTGELVDWVEPYRVVEKAGIRVGIIGANTPGTEHMAFEENIRGLEFAPLLPSIEKWRDHLLAEEDVDFIVLLVHEGLPFDKEEAWEELKQRKEAGESIRADVENAMDLAHVLRDVPVIMGGHTHQGNRWPWVDPYTSNMVFQPFANGSAIGHAILLVDRSTGTLMGYEAPQRDGVLISLWEDEWWPEAEMEAALKPYLDEVNEGLSVVVGRSATELTRRGRSNSPMGNFVTEAMRSSFDADWAFSNTGGLRTDIPAGDVTVGDLMRLLPFGNAMVVVEMEGRMIREILERKGSRGSSGLYQSGIQWVADPLAEHGERVLAATIGGEPLRPDQLYTVVCSDYLMEGNSGFGLLTNIPSERTSYTQLLIRDAVQRYLQENSPVAPRADDRFREERGGEMAAYLRGWDPQ